MTGDKCPYCGEEVEICHDDGYSESEKYNQECHNCGKVFVFTTTISIDHELAKADCLNGGEHTEKLTHTHPKFFSKMYCTQCGMERELTDEEREQLGEEYTEKWYREN